MRTYSELSIQDKVRIYKTKRNRITDFTDKPALTMLSITSDTFKTVYDEIKSTLTVKNKYIRPEYSRNNTNLIFVVVYKGNDVGIFASYEKALSALNEYKEKWLEVKNTYLPRLQHFLSENKMVIGFNVSWCSDTYGLNEEHMYMKIVHEDISYNIKITEGWCVDDSDCKIPQ